MIINNFNFDNNLQIYNNPVIQQTQNHGSNSNELITDFSKMNYLMQSIQGLYNNANNPFQQYFGYNNFQDPEIFNQLLLNPNLIQQFLANPENLFYIQQLMGYKN
jgi:hypothetical protein